MITTRKQALQNGEVTYFTGIPCKHDHIADRRTVNGSCTECVRISKRERYPSIQTSHKEYMKQYYIDNKPRLNKYSRWYYQENQECLKVWSKEHYQQEFEYYRRYNKEYYAAHKEEFQRHNEQYYRLHLDYFIRYWADNAAQYNHNTAKRRATIKQAIPTWANLDVVQLIYQQCKLVSSSTGIPHEVDHIVPLNGELVCGLHWEGNLQILSQRDNRIKSNSHTS